MNIKVTAFTECKKFYYTHCCFLNTLNIMIVYAHGPRTNNETGVTVHACFYFRSKKENSTKKEKQAR